MTKSDFELSLRDTFTWVTPKIDLDNPRWSMRSTELRPPHEYYQDGNPGFFNDSQYISHVVRTRHQFLGDVPRVSAPIPIGRLLLVDYKVSNHNEATEDESSGFFDWADNPPWDLWVGELKDVRLRRLPRSEEVLVAWIPDQFVDVVIRSEQVECMGMFHWADEWASLGRLPDWLVLP